MTEKKTSPEKDTAEEQGEKKIKATTGAWWKGSIANDQGDGGEGKEQREPVAVVTDSAEPEAPEKKERKRPGRPRRKKSTADSGEAEGAPVAQVVEGDKAQQDQAGTGSPGQGGEGNIVVQTIAEAAPPKKRGRRPGRPRRKVTEPPPNEDEVMVGVASASDPVVAPLESGEAIVGEALGDLAEVTEQAAATEMGAEKVEMARPASESGKRPARSRGRKKTTSEAPGPQDDESEDVPEIEEERVARCTNCRLLINAEEPEECRIALLEDGRLESLHVSTVAREHTKSNIYKARIVAVESNLQAAFVDYGPDKNGFLPFSEIHPEYYRPDVSDRTMQLIEQHQWKKLNINEVLERGQEMLVQVVKEEVGNKGANMTTYLSLPGRCVVLMPGSDSSGISRKITGEERRSQLREIMDGLEIPEGIGWIVRTASNDLTEASLSKDVNYLLKLWGEIKAKAHAMDGVGLVYQDHDCVLRFLREHFDPEIKEVLVDDLVAMEKVQDFIDLLPDKQKKTKVRLHKGARPIFNQYNVEDQIESIYQPQVFLPSGGSIVIDPTEALVAIDVNSGSTGKGQNFEDSIFKANMEAATELARQLRLRDLGGLIVVDFIDMRSQKNIREVERQVKLAMKRDKAKVDISRISKFGLMQISRQKLGAPVEALNYQVCPHCQGRGVVRSVETLALFYLRRIQTGASRKAVDRVECRFPLDVAHYLLNNKRQELIELEKRHRIAVTIQADPALKPADHEIHFHKEARERQVHEQ